MSRNALIAVALAITALLLLNACDSLLEIQNEEENLDLTIPNNTDTVPAKIPLLPDVELQKGDHGNDVHVLQDKLIKMGYPIQITGKYDENTVWALTDFQLQHEDLLTTGIFDKKTKKIMIETLDENIEIKAGDHLEMPKKEQSDTELKVIENPYEILSIVNKQHALPADYIPDDLVIPNVSFPFTKDLPKKQLRKVAANALEEMFDDADQARLDLYAQSGYRSYDRQKAIFASNVSHHGEIAANKFSARPGESEHQSGLTMDVTSPDVNYQLIIEFEETDEGKWIQEHASEYGFIIRYPKGKEKITEYQYEPWHLRYVGKKAAKEITEKKLTLEEYLGLK